MTRNTVVMVGLESVGKSAIFRHLTGEVTGDEANVRGSTVRVRCAKLLGGSGQLIDTPGIRTQDDSVTTRLALQAVDGADTVLLVARGTHAMQELDALWRTVGEALHQRPAALAVTFEDKAPPALTQLVERYETELNIPIVLINARTMVPTQRGRLLAAIEQATPLSTVIAREPQRRPLTPAIPRIEAHLATSSQIPIDFPLEIRAAMPLVQPPHTLFEDRVVGPWVALFAVGLLFAMPVYLAYIFADWVQPVVDAALIAPLLAALPPLQLRVPLLFAIIAGDYGLLTLGWYSFLWAFPVVLLIGLSVALTEEAGLKDRITAALDPWLRNVGLNGRDLVPVLSGFGCNVVAVLQTRACSRCTRGACVSMIAFGSACSYQIGASLSLFNSAGAPWLFAPYLVLLFLVGAIYTRLWYGRLTQTASQPLAERAFLQWPTWRGVWWRVRGILRQFLCEAMPIFFIICVVGALLDYMGLLTWLARVTSPLVGLWGLPAEVAPGLIFSIVRKDGLLALNQGQGALLQTLDAGQVFVLVYLSSTLTACLVTLWTIRQELGWHHALTLAARQAATSLLSAFILASLLL